MERQPVMIACSAYISESIKEKCYSVGFKFITDVPISQDFIQQLYKEIDSRQDIFTNQGKKRYSSCI